MQLASGLACWFEYSSIQNFYCFLFKYLNNVFNAIVILKARVKQKFLLNLSLKHSLSIR
jgi:hypothetical protein